MGEVKLLLGGNGQATRIGHGNEVAEMPELHRRLPITLCRSRLPMGLPYLAGMGPAYKVFFKPASAVSAAGRSNCWSWALPRRRERRAVPSRSLRMRSGLAVLLSSPLALMGPGDAAARSPGTSTADERHGYRRFRYRHQAGLCRQLGRPHGPEMRPSKKPDGSIRPFYLKRSFIISPPIASNWWSPTLPIRTAKVPHRAGSGSSGTCCGRARIRLHLARRRSISSPTRPLRSRRWRSFADVLNKVASPGYAPWAVDAPQSIFGKSFAPFALKEGTNFMEYDLVYLRGDLLFWGARNVDGRGFDTEQNRPTNSADPVAQEMIVVLAQ